MPFDYIRVKLYTQRPLPNGVWPYKGFTDCLSKTMQYEANTKNHGNFQCFYAGFMPYYARLFVIAYASQLILDQYKNGQYQTELWTPASYNMTEQIAFNPYEPFTLAFHKGEIQTVVEDIEETQGLSPSMKPLKVV